MFPYHHSKETSSLLLLAQVCSRVPKKQVVTSRGGPRVCMVVSLLPLGLQP